MENQNRYRIAEMLASLRVGRITDEEREELERWRKISPENEELFRKWQEGDFLFGEFIRYHQTDYRRARMEMEQRIKRERHIRLKRRVSLLAASVVILFAVWGGVRWFSGIGELRENQQGEVGLIAAQAPVLKLDDGTVVALDRVLPDFEEAGAVVSQAGDASLSYRVKEDILRDTSVAYHTLNVPKGMEFDLVLADGTRVWLNADSKLKFPVVFVGECREVELEGEAYFQVKEDSLHPFKVAVPGQVVEVLGTEFDVEAYPGGRNVYTTLVKGSVKVDVPGKSVKLTPGMQSVAGQGGLHTRLVNVENAVSWRNGMFVLEDRTLEEIMSDLARWYDLNVSYRTQVVKEIVFKGKIPRYDSCAAVLNILEKTQEVRFEVSGNTVVVYE